MMAAELLPLSVGIGLAVSLLMTELFGIATGGLIVPGYFALSLTQPLHIVSTVAAALVTYVTVHSMASILIIYGRRRTALMILVGYLIGGAARWVTAHAAAGAPGFDVIGYVIPGLLALWLERQGIVETLSSLLTASIIVRLVLVLVAGKELLP
ncbi:MAG TPA: poly-gamma-glutamate biosynthesis protein PgsC [Myxococcota bacterium]|nr:poly-gamma-glutamate biosynthesis protein PgsC [Myxococcota bacterium]